MSEPEVIEHDGAGAMIYRLAPSWGGLRTVAVGRFSCRDAKAGAGLLQDVCDRLRGEGYGAVLGPMDGNTWASYRLVVESDGSASFAMEPHNPEWYPEAFSAAGFEVVSRYISSVRDAGVAVKKPAAPIGVKLRAFDPSRAEEALGAIHALSVKAFAGNAFYTPISREAFVGSYMPVIGVLDPELVLLAEDARGELVGFLFGIPNLAEGAKPESVILKTYASAKKGVGSFLADTFHQRVQERAYERVIHALMHEDNLSAMHSDRTGGRVFRRYALYGVKL